MRQAAPIRIPTDVTIVTLRNAGQNLPQRWTETYARSVLEAASSILRTRSNVEFRLGTIEPVIEEMPAGARADMVDEAGYHYLSAAHRAGNGVRVLMVDRVSQRDLGGQARHETRVCLVAYGGDTQATARILAHELGHLLELNHPDEARQAGPGQEREVAAWLRNLMYSGVINPAAELTPVQIQNARSSVLARRFAGR